jgi:hypothetical protein
VSSRSVLQKSLVEVLTIRDEAVDGSSRRRQPSQSSHSCAKCCECKRVRNVLLEPCDPRRTDRSFSSMIEVPLRCILQLTQSSGSVPFFLREFVSGPKQLLKKVNTSASLLPVEYWIDTSYLKGGETPLNSGAWVADRLKEEAPEFVEKLLKKVSLVDVLTSNKALYTHLRCLSYRAFATLSTIHLRSFREMRMATECSQLGAERSKQRTTKRLSKPRSNQRSSESRQRRPGNGSLMEDSLLSNAHQLFDSTRLSNDPFSSATSQATTSAR